MAILPFLALSEKRIPGSPKWGPPEENGYMRLTSALTIDGVVQEGLTLEMGCFKIHPEKNVILELVYRPPLKSVRVPLIRVDWRPLSGGHTNKRRFKSDDPYVPGRTERDHIHPFEMNFVHSDSRMRNANLPVATNFAIQINTFEELLNESKKMMKISNINVAPKPEWDYDLFNYDDYS